MQGYSQSLCAQPVWSLWRRVHTRWDHSYGHVEIILEMKEILKNSFLKDGTGTSLGPCEAVIVIESSVKRVLQLVGKNFRN